MSRFDYSYREAYQKIQAGAIGRPIVFRANQCQYTDTDPLYYDYLRTCGGSFIDAVIHDIDLSLMFLGEDCTPKACSAHGINAVVEDLAKTGDADNAIGICEYWDGKIAHFYLSRTSGSSGYDNQMLDARGIHIDAIPSWYDRYVPAFVSEAVGWVDAILDGKPMPVPLKSSWKALVIAEALQESLRTGETVKFDRAGQRIRS
ncbi:hypothetical protein BJY01DRAFT_236008 [Aspergillus pseudoustus]|uniref:GFO/IDH/MocA-like oxidoreductase domain-containing protein n=1 Tax=Aspergillus pseudoustus TaxID=1810923 RepID=A0ABR4JTY2_9EURO